MMKGMVFAERYQLADFIGQGGMSLVYRAVDIRTGHSVAVKILKSEYNSDKEFLERFQREAQAASLMSHHNIVNLLDVGVEGEYRYLVLEYVSGNTLKEIIQQKGRMNTNTAIQIAIRILSALQHAHDNGIVHRDIKPQNVLVHSDGHVKVADFGIARMTSAVTISRGDTVVGSVHYSSPEQASGTVADATSDIYSTGIVLYEMLTGQVPFTGDNPVSVAMQHVKAIPAPITDYNPDVPPAVAAVVMKAMEKSPKRRYQGAREMADALIRARDGKEEPPSPQPMRGSGQVRAGTATAAEGRNTQASRRLSPKERAKRVLAQRTRRDKRYLSTTLTVFVVVVVVAILSFGIIQIYHQISSAALAPELVGISTEEAQTLTKRLGLKWQQVEINHDTVLPGLVISQSPEVDTPMTQGDSMVVTISLGPVSAVVPELTGTREEAAAKLKEKGLDMLVSRIASTEPVNTVLSQSPEKGTLLPQGAEVEVTVSGGSTLVPDLTGKTEEELKTLLSENKLLMGKVEYADVEDEILVGKVVNQFPVAGTMAMVDAQITITLARIGKNFHSDVSVTFSPREAIQNLRVTLVEGGMEVEQYAAELAVSAVETNLLIPVSSNISGNLVCRIYLDGILWDEQEVELQ